MDENTPPSAINPVLNQIKSTDPMERIAENSQKNTELLKIIAEKQTFLLEIAEKRHRAEKWARWFVVFKYLFWIGVIYMSFVFTQNLMQNIIHQIPGFGGGPGILDALKGGDTPQNININNLPAGLLDRVGELFGQ